jgi:hypothetical protein
MAAWKSACGNGRQSRKSWRSEKKKATAMTEKDDAPARILVALTASRRDFRALELAASLAARKQAELLALFVEDINLFNLAELPFAKEIDRACAVERALDNLRLARAQKSRIDQIQQALDQLMERLRIQASFRVVRGQFVQAVLSAAEELDILFLCHKEAPADTVSDWCKSAYAKPRLQAPPPVWTMFDGSEGSKRALQMAAELATLGPCELCIALPAESGQAAAALRQGALQTLDGVKLFPNFVAIHTHDLDRLMRLLRQSSCRLLVVDRGAGETIKAVTEAAVCPVVLV